VVGAVAIGGVGIWALHVAALLGLEVHGSEVRYDVPTTVASAAVAVALVAAGLYVVSTRTDRRFALAAAGVLAGLGIVGTHHVGLASVRLAGELHLHPGLAALSAALAVAGATLAMWCSLTLQDWRATAGSAFVLGVAVSATHYTGMAAVSVSGTGGSVVTGSDAGHLLGPFLLLVVGVTILLAFVVGMWPTEEEILAQDELEERVRRERAQRDTQ
jgi:NO-binding membrane sensor protein with MHYT domain